MDRKYLISVIVPTYNRARLLDHTLRSLSLQQLQKEYFEVIVADDGSSDNTKELAEGYKKHLNLKYLFQEDKGYRPASARNKGILHSEGELCLFIDSGVLLDAHCLEEHIKFHLQSDKEIGAIGYVYGFEQEGADMDSLEALIDTANPSNTIKEFRKKNLYLDLREANYKKCNDRIEKLPAPWTLFWTCNVSVKRKKLLEINLFDERYDGNWGCEDNDLGLRLFQTGTSIELNRNASGIHYPHYKNVTEKASQWYANCLLMHEKFNLPETAAFLKNFMKNITNENSDINETLLLNAAG